MTAVATPSKETASLMLSKFLELLTRVESLDYESEAEISVDGVPLDWPMLKLTLRIRGPIVPKTQAASTENPNASQE